ncbi:MAG TPA: YciI family protein [Trebonia sp.]|nr:YciI family protein [Trebonia sp.]
MALYAALVYLPANEYWTDQPEQVHRPSDGYEVFAAEAGAAGVLQGGQGLYPPEMATTITVSGGKGGDVIVTDGPYAEAKEVLGGYFLLEAADLDEATKWASQIPASWTGGKVELRPIVPMQE